LTVGRCSSYSWRCLTSSTPGFSSSGLFLAASPSQRQVKKKGKKKRKKEKEKVLPAGQRREVLRSTTFKPLPPHLKAPF